MEKLTTFQRNNIITGNNLAAEIQSSSPELRAFIVNGAYVLTSSGPVRPSKYLNANHNNIRFWLRKYEVNKLDLEMDRDFTHHDLLDSIYLKDIQSIEELEKELGKYIQDFSIMQASWKVDNPFP